MAVKEIRLPDGRNVVIDEWLHWPLYSTVEFAGGASINLRAFSYVRGQRVPVAGTIPGSPRLATAADTNMAQRQQMAFDESFVMYSITYEAFAAPVKVRDEEDPPEITDVFSSGGEILGSDLRALQRDLMIELILGAGQTKPQLRYPFSFVPQSVGAQAFASSFAGGPPAVSANVGTGGAIHSGNQRRLELPINIPSQRQMYLRVYAPTGTVAGLQTSAIRLRFWLDGMKRRPVVV